MSSCIDIEFSELLTLTSAKIAPPLKEAVLFANVQFFEATRESICFAYYNMNVSVSRRKSAWITIVYQPRISAQMQKKDNEKFKPKEKGTDERMSLVFSTKYWVPEYGKFWGRERFPF